MHTLKQSCAAFLIVAFLAPGLFLGITPPKQAEAQVANIIGDIAGAGVSYAMCEYGQQMEDFLGGMLGGSVGSFFGGGGAGSSVPVKETNSQLLEDVAETRSGTESMLYKECVLDPVAWVIKSVLINTVEQEILDWINSGFYGGPVFLRDPMVFAKSLAREALDVYMSEAMAGAGVSPYLCQPFRTDTIERVYDLSTQSTYGSSGSARCTVSSTRYVNMVENGSVEDGGLLGAMELVSEGNNPYSAFFHLQADAAKRSGELVSREMTIANYNDGYHSQRCLIDGVEGVCTPGQLVSKQVDDWLGGALGQLEVADEVSEVVSQLVANLVSEIFSDEEDGLLAGRRLENDDANAYESESGFESDPVATSGGATSDSSVVVSWTDPDTGETWVSNGEGGFLNTSTGQTVADDGSGGFVDTTSGTAVSVSLPEGVTEALKDVDWVEAAFTTAKIATYFTDLPSWAVTVAELGYTVATDWEGFVNAYESASLVGSPGTNLDPDAENAGSWTDPDTGETWGGYTSSGWTDPDTGETYGSGSGDSGDTDSGDNVGGEAGSSTGTGGGYNDGEGGVTGL